MSTAWVNSDERQHLMIVDPVRPTSSDGSKVNDAMRVAALQVASKSDRPLEIVFRPGQTVGIVHLRNPRNPGPEIEYLRQALPEPLLSPTMNPFPTVRAALLPEPQRGDEPWLVEGLWMREAVGIIGGEPKCGKSFLALDLAVVGQHRSLAKRGERRPAQWGAASNPVGGPATQVTAEQPNLAIRCAIRIRKYGASNTSTGSFYREALARR